VNTLVPWVLSASFDMAAPPRTAMRRSKLERSHRFFTRNGLGHRTVTEWREESFEDFTLAVVDRDTTK
jgi:hypothetical protein